MKSRLLAHRPSPAMVVAIVALVLSLTGGALAAALIDTGDIKKGAVTKKKLHKNAVVSKKVKNSSLKAKDFAAGELPQGEQGPKGDKGEKGDKGDDGADGTSVFASTIPSGETVTGAWGIGAAANAASIFVRETVSLPVRSAAELTDALVNMDNDASSDTDGDAECTGTAAAPTAPAGKVCIYQTFNTNVNQIAGFQISSTSGDQNTFGFNVRARSTAAGSVDARGTWAYTAP